MAPRLNQSKGSLLDFRPEKSGPLRSYDTVVFTEGHIGQWGRQYPNIRQTPKPIKCIPDGKTNDLLSLLKQTLMKSSRLAIVTDILRLILSLKEPAIRLVKQCINELSDLGHQAAVKLV